MDGRESRAAADPRKELTVIPLDAHLLAAVLAEPESDALRLICADFWEEQGETERAEFVRVQIELAIREGYAGADRSHWGNELKRRMENLCCRERELMWQPFESPPIYRWTERLRGVGLVTWTFRRGFIHAIACTVADWLAHADAIRALEPVQAVTLTTWPECLQPHGFRNPCRRFDETAQVFPWCDACRLTTEESRAKRWPGIAFTLPTALPIWEHTPSTLV